MSQNSLLKTCLNTKIGVLTNKQQTHTYMLSDQNIMQ